MWFKEEFTYCSRNLKRRKKKYKLPISIPKHSMSLVKEMETENIRYSRCCLPSDRSKKLGHQELVRTGQTGTHSQYTHVESINR